MLSRPVLSECDSCRSDMVPPNDFAAEISVNNCVKPKVERRSKLMDSILRELDDGEVDVRIVSKSLSGGSAKAILESMKELRDFDFTGILGGFQ